MLTDVLVLVIVAVEVVAVVTVLVDIILRVSSYKYLRKVQRNKAQQNGYAPQKPSIQEEYIHTGQEPDASTQHASA